MNRITCINKDDRKNPYERITHLGGTNSSGGIWKLTQTEVISKIDAHTHSFYVNAGGERVKVITATSHYGNKYVKTEADGDEPNNLLSLPECK
jgi:hypothetical protein